MKQPLRSTTETAGISAGDPLPIQPGSLREIHYLCVVAPLRLCVYFFQTAGISAGDPLPKQPGSLREIPYILFTPDHYLRASAFFFPCVFAPLRLCVYFFQNSRDLPVHHVAAVDVDRLAGDLPGKRRRKKDNHRRDVLRRLPVS